MDWVLAIRTPLLTPFFQNVTWLGYGDFLFLFIPFCYWFCEREYYNVFPQFVFISAVINSFSKSLFQDPRPDNYLNIDPWLDTLDPSFGFPSGHAQLAVIIWGFIFLRSNNFYIKIISLFLLLTISFSRIYLGVHDISDVIGGMIIGILSLIFLELILRKKIAFLNRVNIENIGIIYLFSFLILLFFWPNENNGVLIGLGSLIIGFWLGKLIDQKYFKFDNSINLLPRIVSAIIALIGFIALNNLIDKFIIQILNNHYLEIAVPSLILGLYISLISLIILKYMKLQRSEN